MSKKNVLRSREIGTKISSLIVSLVQNLEKESFETNTSHIDALKSVLQYIVTLTGIAPTNVESGMIYSQQTPLEDPRISEVRSQISGIYQKMLLSTFSQLQNEQTENRQLRNVLQVWIEKNELYSLKPRPVNFSITEEIKETIQKLEEFCMLNKNMKQVSVLVGGRVQTPKGTLGPNNQNLPDQFFVKALNNLGNLKKRVVEVIRLIRDFEKQTEVNYMGKVFDMVSLNEKMKVMVMAAQAEKEMLLVQNKNLLEKIDKLNSDLIKMADSNSILRHQLNKFTQKKKSFYF